MAPESAIRQIVTVVESVPSADGKTVWRRAAAMAVVTNPLAGKYEEDLAELSALGASAAGELLRALRGCATPDGAEAIGQAAAVGQDGEIEHASALIGPEFSAATRSALFATDALPASTRARIKIGAPIDLAFQSRRGAASTSGIPNWRLTVDGHPRDDEAVVVLALAAPASDSL